jgi:hypothetical protein
MPGLVRRRAEEAILLEYGRYTGVSGQPQGVPREEQAEAPKKADPIVKEAQAVLKDKGFDPGKVDGWYGPKTKAAVKRYQEMHPHLTADGILGPATLSQLRRDAQAIREAVKNGGGLTAAGGVLSMLAGLPWGWIAACVAVGAVVYFGWRYRDVVQRRWNTFWRSAGKQEKA